MHCWSKGGKTCEKRQDYAEFLLMPITGHFLQVALQVAEKRQGSRCRSQGNLDIGKRRENQSRKSG